MNSSKSVPAESISRTVARLCSSIAAEAGRSTGTWSEQGLRRELVACILGSQVRNEAAAAAANNLEAAGLLGDALWTRADCASFEASVFGVLSARCCYGSSSYRFPKLRARQVAGTRQALSHTSLRDRLRDDADPLKLRRRLVRDLPGIGPKQASMFLRNVGVSTDLAVLDTHVLHFASIVGLCGSPTPRTSSLAQYERIELLLVDYSKRLGHAVGHVDLAIWATMRALREIEA